MNKENERENLDDWTARHIDGHVLFNYLINNGYVPIYYSKYSIAGGMSSKQI
jgi:hypothetical protein